MESKTRESPKKDTIRLVTETEHLLYKHFTEEREQRQKLESLVKDLKSQVAILQEQLKCLAESPKPTTTMDTSHPRVEYSTDEEDLARETEWIRTKTRKKRKLNVSPTQDDTSNDEGKNKDKTPKIHLPPPIIVDGIKDYQGFFDFLSENQAADAFSMKLMNGETVKVNAANEESYRLITKALSLNNCMWHSYENKQERPIRVMVKKLHSTCKPERIVEDLNNKGYKIIEAVNKLSWKTKAPLNMFMLTFKNDEDINKVYHIETILGYKVEVQPLKTTKLVPQCKRCQAYGHTQKYCSKEPRCVKCTGKHLTIDCKKPIAEKPKCIHCGAAHPANYRGCAIAKEIQAIRNRNTKMPTASAVRQHNVASGYNPGPTANKPNVMQNTTKHVSYAQVASKSISKVPQVPNVASNNDKKLDEILKFMSSFDERLKKIEGSTISATTKKKK